MYAEMDVPQLLSVCRDDASKWAAAFCEIVKKGNIIIDEGFMIGWFANAIEHSHDVRTGSGPTILPEGARITKDVIK